MKRDSQFKFSVLASGSTGNSTYLETPGHRILIDGGLSGRKIEQLMASINRSLKDVDAIFVTHEHSDHCQGVGVLARRYGLQVYANRGTWAAMSRRLGKIDPLQKHLIEPGEVKDFGDMQVESFSVSHDAAEPQFYQVHHDDQTFCVLTDTGYVSDHVAGTIRNADTYLMECNHDVQMLREGPYAWSLKQRILGDSGHLSNEEGANALMSVIGRRTNEILLGHRSQHNNRRSLAHLTVASMMTQHDFGVDHDFMLEDAEPEKATPIRIV